MSMTLLLMVVAVLIGSTHTTAEHRPDEAVDGGVVSVRYEILDDTCDPRYIGGCTMFLCFSSAKEEERATDGGRITPRLLVQGVGSLYRGIQGYYDVASGMLSADFVDGRRGLDDAFGTGVMNLTSFQGVYVSNNSHASEPWWLRPSPNQTSISVANDCLWVPPNSTPPGAINAEYSGLCNATTAAGESTHAPSPSPGMSLDESDQCTDNFQCIRPDNLSSVFPNTMQLYGTWSYPLNNHSPVPPPHVYGNCSWGFFVGIRTWGDNRNYYGNWTVSNFSGVALYKTDWSGPMPRMRGNSGHPGQPGNSPYCHTWYLVPDTESQNLTTSCRAYDGGSCVSVDASDASTAEWILTQGDGCGA